MTYHIERSGRGIEYTIEIWSSAPGRPDRCVAILLADADRREEAEKLAQKVVEIGNDHASAPTLLDRIEQSTAVLRWYLLHYGNAGSAEYAIQQNEAVIAAAKGTA